MPFIKLFDNMKGLGSSVILDTAVFLKLNYLPFQGSTERSRLNQI